MPRVAPGAVPTVELHALMASGGRRRTEGADGIFRIVRGVAIGLGPNPDFDLIDELVATSANTPDRETAGDLLARTSIKRTSPGCRGTPPMPAGPPARDLPLRTPCRHQPHL